QTGIGEAMKQKTIKIGMIGLGTVGTGVWEILERHHGLLSRRVGASLDIIKVAVRSKAKRRGARGPASLLPQDFSGNLSDPEIRLVVEVMGGVRESRQIALAAIKAGKHLVTANKALLALHGKEIFLAARKAKVDVCFEAAVAGGIPVLRALREGFVGNQIRSIFGIVNGTCNFILSEMSRRGTDFQAALRRA